MLETSIRAFEQIAMFTGLGIVIVLVAAMTLGRCLVAADSGSLPAGDAPDGPDYFTPGDDATAGTYSTGTAPPPSGR